MKTISRFIALKIVCGFLIFAFGGVTFAQDDLNSGLAAYYPFNGNANDESGNGNHGTVLGASLTTDRVGNPNSAYSFDGVNDYIDIGSDASLKMTDGLTISAWINMASYTPIFQNIISDHAPNEITVGPGKILRLNHNTLQFLVGGIFGFGTGIYVEHTLDNATLGKWQHAAGTYDRDIVRLYLNGVEVASRQHTDPLTVNSNPILIGKSGFGEYMHGIVDDVHIYNRALSETEIQALFTGGLLCSCPTDDCLKGCISGMVEDAKTGQPLAGKLVKLKRISPKGAGMTLMNVVTDTGGCYSFSNLDDGTYTITVKGCKGGGKKVVVISGGSKEEGKNFRCK